MHRILVIGATGNVGREVLPQLLTSLANMLLDAWAAAAGQPGFVTSTVAHVTGVPPRAFLDWATDHVLEFQRDQTVV